MTVDQAMNRLPARQDEFRLGPWLVQPTRHRLVCSDDRNGAEVSRSLEPRLMKLLCVLAAADGEVVSRDDLVNTLWPRVVVTENSLSRAISDLRRQLEHPEAGGNDQAAVETIPKRGYRLATPVRTPEHTTGSGTIVPPRTTRASWAIAAGLAVVTVLVTWVSLLPDTAGPQASLSETPYTVADVLVGDREIISGARYENTIARYDIDSPANGAVLSRDGTLYALVRYGDEGSSLVIGATTSSQSPLTIYSTGEFIHSMQWSPVGNALLFAVSARLDTASLTGNRQQGRLMLFDLDTLTLTELLRQNRSDHGIDEDNSGKLT